MWVVAGLIPEGVVMSSILLAPSLVAAITLVCPVGTWHRDRSIPEISKHTAWEMVLLKADGTLTYEYGMEHARPGVSYRDTKTVSGTWTMEGLRVAMTFDNNDPPLTVDFHRGRLSDFKRVPNPPAATPRKADR
jgi:hypothetical protein